MFHFGYMGTPTNTHLCKNNNNLTIEGYRLRIDIYVRIRTHDDDTKRWCKIIQLIKLHP